MFEFVAFRKSLNDIQLVLRQISMVTTHILGLAKLWVLIAKQNKMEVIKEKLQSKQFRYDSVIDGFQPGQLMNKEKQFIIRLSTFLFFLYSFVGVSAHLSAAAMVEKHTIGQQFVNNTSCEMFLPYSFYSPWDKSTANMCHISLFFMDISLNIYAWYIACLDGILISFLHILKTQLDIVQQAFHTLRRRCILKLGLNKNFQVFNDIDYPPLENEMYKEIIHCIEHLKLLLDVRNNIEDAFSTITLIQTCSSLFIFASCLFTMAREPKSSPNFFSQLQYFIAVLSQFSVYCWFGNEITESGKSVPSALYRNEWINSSKRFKMLMLFTIVRMQRPVYMSIGKFTPLTLSTLLSVLKGSFSYFTLFQTVGED